MIDFVSAHPYYAYSAIFLAALSEAIPVVGTVVPGSTLVVTISALAAGASANSWLMLVAATVGVRWIKWFCGSNRQASLERLCRFRQNPSREIACITTS